jgi:predicted transcriptional regulator
MSEDLPTWRDTPAKQSIVEFVAAVTDRDSGTDQMLAGAAAGRVTTPVGRCPVTSGP